VLRGERGLTRFEVAADFAGDNGRRKGFVVSHMSESRPFAEAQGRLCDVHSSLAGRTWASRQTVLLLFLTSRKYLPIMRMSAYKCSGLLRGADPARKGLYERGDKRGAWKYEKALFIEGLFSVMGQSFYY
jgi:hypothetical protein